MAGCNNSPVLHCIVLAYMVFPHLLLRWLWRPMIGHEKAFLHGKIFPGNKTGGPVHLPVPRPFKPFEGPPLFRLSISRNTRATRKFSFTYFTTFSTLPFDSGSALWQNTGWKCCSLTNVWNFLVSIRSPGSPGRSAPCPGHKGSFPVSLRNTQKHTHVHRWRVPCRKGGGRKR